MEYTNIYRHCGEEWESLADSMCNDRCPTCNKEIEPTCAIEEKQVFTVFHARWYSKDFEAETREGALEMALQELEARTTESPESWKMVRTLKIPFNL